MHRSRPGGVGHDQGALVIAHRTCPLDAPENSIAGVRAAAAAGADLVEVDVRRAADGVPVLLHDPLLWRTTRWPLPVRLVPSRVAPVPTLAAALDAAGGLGLALDVKDPRAMPAAVGACRDAGVLDRVLLWAQAPGAVADAVRLAPGTETALLRDTHTDAATRDYLRDAAALGASAVSLHQDAATPEVVAAARGAGLRVYCWAQSEDRLAPTIEAGVDGVVTDWPAAARRLLEQR